MLKLKDISPKVKVINNESNDYLIIKFSFEDRESLTDVCYWSTSGPKKSLIEIGLEEHTGLIFKINVVAATIMHNQDILIFYNEIVQKEGLPVFSTDSWRQKFNPLGYHVEFYDPEYYVQEKNDFEVYAGEKNTTILFSANKVVLHVINEPVIFGFDADNNLCYVRIQNMALNDEGFLEALH